MNNGAEVRRGDIVWARVQFPHKWWPALVLSSHPNLGVFVSFFNNDTNIPFPRTCFVESEVVPFDDAFPSLISPPRLNHDTLGCETFRASLRSALRLLGLRVVSSLRCRCCSQTGHEEDDQRVLVRGGSGRAGFDPSGVLGFVLDAAVFPWVEAPRLVDAVRVIAQVHAFRAYSSTRHKRLYRETPKLGENVKQHPCSSLGQKIHSVTQESVPLEPKGKFQIISKQGEENMVTSATRRLKSTVPVLEGNSEQLFENKLMIIPEAPPTTNDGKAELLVRSHALGPFHIWGESLRLERQNLLIFNNILDHGIVDICFGNCSTMSRTNFSISSNFKTHMGNYIGKRKDNAQGHCCRLPYVETTICLNRKRRRLDKHALCHVFPQISRVQESEGNAYISNYSRPEISHIKMLEPEGVQKDNQVCICFCETNINFTGEFQKVDLKRSQNLTLQQSFTCESSSNSVLGFHSDNYEVDASAAKVKYILGSNSSVYQRMLQRICSGEITPLKSKESARIKSSSGDCLVEGKDCYQNVASCSIFNSKVGQQSKTHVPFSSTSLHMKFPKNFSLPSKGQVIKKFSVFGSVDSSKTRVFCYTGSAQVAFYQEGDAVAAYQYAKKKVWFGESNIRFWLDSFEHKRRESKRFSLMPPSASKPIGPPLKSCLKKSNSLKQENKKKHYRVRFTIET